MTLLQASILGFVEGVTEFLPISSTAHLLVLQRMMGISSTLFFDTVVQLGALLAVIVYFWKKLLVMLTETFVYLQDVSTRKLKPTQQNVPTGVSILVASLPVLFVGFLLRKKIAIIHESIPVIALMSIVVGILLVIAQHRANNKNDRPVKARHIVTMGLYQILALIPGTSRSGITIAGGVFAGLSFQQALEYSFFLSIPALGVAGMYELLSALKEHPSPEVLLATGLATLISFVCAIGVIHFLLTWVKKIGFYPFVIYRVIFGIAILFIR